VGSNFSAHETFQLSIFRTDTNYLTGKDLISLNYTTQFSLLEHFFANKLNLDTILWTINNPQTLINLRKMENTIILTDLQKPYY